MYVCAQVAGCQSFFRNVDFDTYVRIIYRNNVGTRVCVCVCVYIYVCMYVCMTLCVYVCVCCIFLGNLLEYHDERLTLCDVVPAGIRRSGKAQARLRCRRRGSCVPILYGVWLLRFGLRAEVSVGRWLDVRQWAQASGERTVVSHSGWHSDSRDEGRVETEHAAWRMNKKRRKTGLQ